ncbi:patatin-like phospholipase domain-containing protein 4 [Lingula anatina]|uniref:Patatin-like phospholipase domain-containing protein 4 n=1 Tax=Lingula anatina TaxID=7574 RepID=A0A1S3HMI8_LINAN|nr:patatin-like phospholipase domain-containing protein 4 [Lingula anatina]|eukprot:XP_013386264.1 patatin-like phospholipase domain-containing protein 4 [Lingula anatina]
MTYHLSFCGCGLMVIYQVGVVECFITHGGRFLSRVDKLAGASAGALVAVAMATKLKEFHIMKDLSYKMAAGIRQREIGIFTQKSNIMLSVEQHLREFLPEDAHQMATGKLFTSLSELSRHTKPRLKNILISEYDSNGFLIQCLLASCHIPGYAGTTKPLHIRGKSYIDGGFTDNLPVFPTGRTITVSPFSGHQDISPTDRSVLGLRVRTVNQDFQFNLRNLHRGVRALVPPNKTGLERIYEQGWGDAVRFLKKEGLFDQ